METISVIAGVIGTIIALIALQKQFYSRPKEEIEHLIVQFRSNQKMSIETRELLIEYATKFDCWNEDLMPKISYAEYIDVMAKTYQENLSDEMLQKTLDAKPSKSLISSMLKSLEAQFEGLMTIRSQMRILLKK